LPNTESTTNQRGPSRSGSRERRKPRRISPKYLERAAVFHLERFSSTAWNLRRVLGRKIERSCRFHGDDPAQFAEDVDALIERLVALGQLDDRQYGEALIRRIRRRGGSTRQIRARLREKGLAASLVEELVAPDDGTDPDLAAACRYVRRRRLGPYRPDEQMRRDRRERDLAALARNGFWAATAKRVVDAASEEEIDHWLSEPGD
jgi:regulatory protein